MSRVRESLSLVLALLVLTSASAASALTMEFGGDGDPSLKGTTGSLAITGPLEDGVGTFDVAWSMNFDGYEGSATNHPELTQIAFKAFRDISSISLDSIDWSSAVSGTTLFPANVNNHGCVAGSNAGMVCVNLDPGVDATMGGTFTANFTVEGEVDLSSWSYRGKFGPQNGWVISESGGASPVPEPTAALIFAAGIATVSLRLRPSAKR